MPAKDPRIDAYIAKSAPFAQSILKHLRKLVHTGCPRVEETFKWSMPHFEDRGMLCRMAAFKHHCTFGFWKAALIFPENLNNEGQAMGHFGRITALSDLPPADVLLGYVRKAVELNDAGVKSPRPSKPRTKPVPLVIPVYFQSALRTDVKAQQTFARLSHSQQKEYVEWLTDAKRDATREQRLATSIEWLAEGKTRMWKYQPKRS